MPGYGGIQIPNPDILSSCSAGFQQGSVYIPSQLMSMITGQPSSGFDTGIGGTQSKNTSSKNTSGSNAPKTSGGSGPMAGIIGSTQHGGAGGGSGGGGLLPWQIRRYNDAYQGQPPQPWQTSTNGGASGGGANTQMNMPPTSPYTPYGGGGGDGGGGGGLGGNLDYMSQYSQGLMDPNSDYYKRLSGAMQEQIGGQAAAQ